MALVRSSLRLPANSPIRKQFLRNHHAESQTHSNGLPDTLSHSAGPSQETPQAQLSNLLRQVNTMSATVQQLIVESDGAVLEESSIKCTS